jgi:hypothetical protein
MSQECTEIKNINRTQEKEKKKVKDYGEKYEMKETFFYVTPIFILPHAITL